LWFEGWRSGGWYCGSSRPIRRAVCMMEIVHFAAKSEWQYSTWWWLPFWGLSLLRCDAVSFCEWSQSFRRTVLPSFSMVKWMKMRHISQYRNPQFNRCENFVPLLPASLIYGRKTNKCNNCSFSLLIMYGVSYMFRHYIAMLRERFECLLRDVQLKSSR
jgi:hypothetical protein